MFWMPSVSKSTSDHSKSSSRQGYMYLAVPIPGNRTQSLGILRGSEIQHHPKHSFIPGPIEEVKVSAIPAERFN